jgi:RHS repeat-associated protein
LFIQTEEGKAELNGGTYSYVYDLKDHLGNVRVSFDKFNNAARIIQENEYYAFGLTKSGGYDNSNNNRFLYNGKEIQTDLTNQYDYSARFYDPVIGRWSVIDPLAENNRRWSPYNYVSNNPISRIDPDGMEDGGNPWEYDTTDPGEIAAVLGSIGTGEKILLGGNGDDGGKDKPDPHQSSTSRYAHIFLKDISNYDFGYNVTNTWVGWADHPASLGTDLLSGLSSLANNTLKLFDANAWVATYNNTVSYINAPPEIKAHSDAAFFNGMLSGFGAAAPLGELGGISVDAYSKVGNFGVNNGYGVFGENGLNIGTYKINALYGSETPGAGTIFSAKQGFAGGNMIRWDFGPLHGSIGGDFVFHSTFRFNINGSTYGSSAQYPAYAPFVFWKYQK